MKKLTLLLMAVLMLAACTSKREKQQNDIKMQEANLSAMDYLTDDTDISEILTDYRSYARHYSNDSLAPVYLMRAADICNSVGKYEEAIGLLDTIIGLYPGYEDMGGCWFLKGLAYENAGEIDSARAAYTYFVDNYPEHSLAPDTRKMLDLVGMSPEDILEILLNNE